MFATSTTAELTMRFSDLIIRGGRRGCQFSRSQEISFAVLSRHGRALNECVPN